MSWQPRASGSTCRTGQSQGNRRRSRFFVYLLPLTSPFHRGAQRHALGRDVGQFIYEHLDARGERAPSLIFPETPVRKLHQLSLPTSPSTATDSDASSGGCTSVDASGRYLRLTGNAGTGMRRGWTSAAKNGVGWKVVASPSMREGANTRISSALGMEVEGMNVNRARCFGAFQFVRPFQSKLDIAPVQ